MARGLSFTTVSVLHAVARGYEYGFDVIDGTGLPSGTVYPALSRLERDGYVRSDWEDEQTAHADKRPPRRYYRITAPGLRALDDALRRYRALRPVRTGRIRPARGRG
jgi:PadR family transcriptional regulator, regulatory protein PadR